MYRKSIQEIPNFSLLEFMAIYHMVTFMLEIIKYDLPPSKGVVMIKIKRIYEKYSQDDDGFRILIDRLWPRGISKSNAHVDLWFKEIAPTDRLRKWFSHDPKKWEVFNKRYAKELEENKELVDKVKDLEKEHKVVTLVFSAKDEQHNNAIVLGKALHVS
jgi:uncharacterized protein YeaO (DUF488 family)